MVQRQPWLDPSGEKLALDIAQMAVDGQIDEAEWCARWLRTVPTVPEYPTGEELFPRIAQRIGAIESVARERVNDASAQATITRLNAWYAGGSPLARLSQTYATLHVDSAYGLSFPWGSRATDRKLEQHRAQLAELLTEDACPVAALELMLTLSYMLGSDPAALEGTLISFMQRYPRELAPYTGMCRLLAHNWTGEIGQVGAYLDAVSTLQPEEERDVFYARCVTRGWQELQSSAQSAGQSTLALDLDRLWRGAEKMMANQTATAHDLSMLVELTTRYGKPELTDKLSAYYQRHYPLLSKSAYRSPSVVRRQARNLQESSSKER